MRVVSAIVPDDDPSISLVLDHPAVAVVADPATLFVDVRRNERFDRRGREHAVPRQSEMPAVEIADVRKYAAESQQAPGRAGTGCGGPQIPVVVVTVSDRLTRPARLVVEARAAHASGFEKLLAQVVLKRTTRRDLDDRCEQPVAGIGVEVVRTRLEFERCIQGPPHGIRPTDLDEVALVDVPRQTGRVGEKLMQRDPDLVQRNVVEERRKRIGHAQTPLFLQLQNRRGRELLRERARIEDRLFPDRNLTRHIRQPVSSRHEHLTVLCDEHGSRKSGPSQIVHILCYVSARRILVTG